jgi:hypothetical protein
MRIACLIVLSLVAMVVIVGCGGTSTEATVPNVTLLSKSVRDGQATATLVVTNADRVKIGDDANNAGMRAFVSFDLADIPAGAIIDSATLEIYQANNVDAEAEKPGPPIVPAVAQVQTVGNSYAAVSDTVGEGGLGPVVVEHVYYGDTLTTAAYDMAVLPGPGVSGDMATVWVLGYKQIDVTAAVLDDVANKATRSYSQFRIKHVKETNSNPGDDKATPPVPKEDSDSWIMGEGQGDTANHKPGLVILYHLPTTP